MLPIENFSKLMVSVSQKRVLPIVQQGNQGLLRSAEVVSDFGCSERKEIFNAPEVHGSDITGNSGKFQKGPLFLL